MNALTSTSALLRKAVTTTVNARTCMEVSVVRVIKATEDLRVVCAILAFLGTKIGNAPILTNALVLINVLKMVAVPIQSEVTSANAMLAIGEMAETALITPFLR